MLILYNARDGGFLEGTYENLPDGQLFYPRPLGVWIRLSTGDFVGTEPKEELEQFWGAIRDFDELMSLTRDAADAVTAR